MPVSSVTLSNTDVHPCWPGLIFDDKFPVWFLMINSLCGLEWLREYIPSRTNLSRIPFYINVNILFWWMITIFLASLCYICLMNMWFTSHMLNYNLTPNEIQPSSIFFITKFLKPNILPTRTVYWSNVWNYNIMLLLRFKMKISVFIIFLVACVWVGQRWLDFL